MREDATIQMTGDTAAHGFGTLLADLNHEIRTSMNGIAGMLALLLDTELSATQKRYATNARHSADNLMALIENVIDLSMIDANRFELAQASFDLLSVVQAACALPSAAAQSKGLALYVNFPPALSLRGDPARIQQIIHGLLNSAVSFTSEGPITPDFTAVIGNAGRCRLSMTVNMAACDGQQVFDLLNQHGNADPIALRVYGRAGLELALCTRLATLMDARTSADIQAAGQCSIRFSVELPQATGPLAGVHMPLAEQNAADIGRRVAGRRILVADDNPVNQQVAQRMVEKFGCQADVAADGQQAVAMHEARPYDLILMDCQMPHLDGFQATERIRALDGAARRTPVIALTACATQGERERCLSSGMDDFISKPVRPQMLEDVLGRWLSRVPVSPADTAAMCSDELEIVRDMFGADFAELATLYQADSPPRIDALREAGAAGDSSRVAKVAHAFSGSSVSIGATGLSALCKELEMRAKADALDDFGARLAAIEAEYGRISVRLRSMAQLSSTNT